VAWSALVLTLKLAFIVSAVLAIVALPLGVDRVFPGALEVFD
jgi:hypothetical protein